MKSDFIQFPNGAIVRKASIVAVQPGDAIPGADIGPRVIVRCDHSGTRGGMLFFDYSTNEERDELIARITEELFGEMK